MNKLKDVVMILVCFLMLGVLFLRYNQISLVGRNVDVDFLYMMKICDLYIDDTSLQNGYNEYILSNENNSFLMSNDESIEVKNISDKYSKELINTLSEMKISVDLRGSKLNKKFFQKEERSKFYDLSILDINTGYTYSFRVVKFDDGSYEGRYSIEGGVVSNIGNNVKSSYDQKFLKIDNMSTEKLYNMFEKDDILE